MIAQPSCNNYLRAVYYSTVVIFTYRIILCFGRHKKVAHVQFGGNVD